MAGEPTARHAAVLGHPVEHSLSPVLHLAAYRALGLTGWTYSRVDCPAERLPELVSAAPAAQVGYSVTMPGKFAALEIAEAASDRARAIGSANTLVRRGSGWWADCTDVDGARGALSTLGLPDRPGPAVVIGVGGTARPVLAGLADAGVEEVVLVSRRDNAGPALDCARHFGLEARSVLLDDPGLDQLAATSDVLVSTVPVDAAAAVTGWAARAPRVFDVLYDPWPTPLVAAARSRGADVVAGDVMLAHQAFGQVEAFTGRSAPRAEMTAALERALAERRG